MPAQCRSRIRSRILKGTAPAIAQERRHKEDRPMTDPDLPAKLRALYVETGANYVQAAADEIERLRERLAEYEPAPLVVNQKAPGDLAAGDYVFASRWGDCDPGDPWAVGHVIETGRQDSAVYPGWVKVEGSSRRWVHAMKITHEQGARICAQFPGMEHLPQNYKAIAHVFAGDTDD